MSPWIKFPLSLIVILAIFGGCYLLLRRLTGARLISSGSEQNRNRQPRLGVVDVYDLDRTRQLVLLRRDNVEHLLLIGGPNDTVIETNIVRVTGGKPAVAPEMQFERPDPLDAGMRSVGEQPMRPVIESGVRPVVASRPAVAAPSFADTPPPAYPEVSTASQAAVAAASFAAVAAATQHEIDTTPAEVPDFLRTPHDAHMGQDLYTQHDVHNMGNEIDQRVEEIAAQPPAYVEPKPFRTAYTPVVPPLATREQEPVFVAPVVVPEPAPVPEFVPAPHIEPEPVEPEPVLAPIQPEVVEERWPRHTPFSSIDSSIGDYSKLSPHVAPVKLVPVHVEPTHAEPIHIEPTHLEPIATVEEPVSVADVAPEVAAEEYVPVAAPLQLDQTTFSDMARQLEEALAHSQSAQKQEPAPFEEASPIKQPEAVEEQSLPVAIEEMPLPHDATLGETVMAEPEPEAPVVPSAPEPAHGNVKPTAKAPKSNDPFSLDDIEAEFARLLGRSGDKPDKG